MAKANAGKLTVFVLKPVGPKHNKKTYTIVIGHHCWFCQSPKAENGRCRASPSPGLKVMKIERNVVVPCQLPCNRMEQMYQGRR